MQQLSTQRCQNALWYSWKMGVQPAGAAWLCNTEYEYFSSTKKKKKTPRLDFSRTRRCFQLALHRRLLLGVHLFAISSTKTVHRAADHGIPYTLQQEKAEFNFLCFLSPLF